jgi:hypothetical protein
MVAYAASSPSEALLLRPLLEEAFKERLLSEEGRWAPLLLPAAGAAGVKKIPSVFKRNYEGDRLIRDEVVEGCEWVLAGEGVATVKYDGTACAIRGGKLFKRYDAKGGKPPPPGFEPAQEPDPVTGHWPGWVPVGDDPSDKYHREAFDPALRDGTYELCGPKVQGNPHGLTAHELLPHGILLGLAQDASTTPRTFDGLREYLAPAPIEGIVFHHPDGRMAKVKRTDFGFAWGSKKARR